MNSHRHACGHPLDASIRKVPWTELSHAYGPAREVPDLLRAMYAGDMDAWQDFWNFLMHQGTLYPATVAVIPILLEWLADPDAPQRAEVWSFLRAALSERPHNWGSHSYTEIYGANYGEVVQDVQAALQAGGAFYLERARNGEEVDRVGAYAVLGELPELLTDSLPLLSERVHSEESLEMQVAALETLGRLGRFTEGETREPLLGHLLSLLADEDAPLTLRTAAARMVAEIEATRLPDWTPDVLSALVWDSPPSFVESYAFYEWIDTLSERRYLLRVLLRKLLSHPEAEIRRAAIDTIQRLAEEWRTERAWAGETLTAQLRQDADPTVRLRLIERLGQLGMAGRRAVPQLLDLAEGPDSEVTLSAVVALLRLRWLESASLACPLLGKWPVERLAPLLWVLRDLEEVPSELTLPVLSLMRRVREEGLSAEAEEFGSPAYQRAELWATLVWLTADLRGYEAEIEAELIATLRATSHWQVLDPCAEQLGKRRVRVAIPALSAVKGIFNQAPHSYEAIYGALVQIGGQEALEALQRLGLPTLLPDFMPSVQAAYFRAVQALSGDGPAPGDSFELEMRRWQAEGHSEAGLLTLLDHVRGAGLGQWDMLEPLLPHLQVGTEAARQALPLLSQLAQDSAGQPLWYRLPIAAALLRLTGDAGELERVVGDFADWKPLPLSGVPDPVLSLESADLLLPHVLPRLAHDPHCQLSVRSADTVWQDERLQAWAQAKLTGAMTTLA